MLRDRAEGAQEFARLFEKYPDDGMLFLERGEAFECLGLLDEAETDYHQAEAHLTSPHWKQVAALAGRRVLKSRAQKTAARFVSVGDQQWDAFHRVHGLFRLPHDIRKRALPAIARIGAEPESAAVDLRWCVEVVVGKIEDRSGHSRSGKDLYQRIDDLKQSGLVSSTIARQMDSVREFGKRGAHPEGSARRADWVTGLSALVEVLAWAETKLWGL